MTTGILALTILGAFLVQIAVVALVHFIRRKRQYQKLSTSSGECQVIMPSSGSLTELDPPGLAWEGFREFIVQRRVFEDDNHAVCSFYLAPVDGKPLRAFKPGQFLTLKLTVKDSNAHRSKTVVRCYTLSDSPRSDYYRITIKRIPAPVDQPDSPPGISSSFFHNDVREGSRLLVKAPAGQFCLVEDDPLPIVLICGGIGITPMLSILNTVLEAGIDREILLFYGVGNGKEHIMKDHLQALAGTHDNLHLHICYSAPEKNDAKGVDYQHRGRVDIPLLRATLQLTRHQFYVCGPRPMMESIIPGLEDWGVNRGDIYYESFGPATLVKEKRATPEQPMTITFSQSGKSVLWDTAADSLLDLAEANGVEVMSGCRAGSCGSCQTLVRSGEVDYNQEPDAVVKIGYCLLCISTPKSDLTLVA